MNASSLAWPAVVLLALLVGFRQIALLKPTNVAELRVWFGGALAAFVDGFIDGAPVGAPAGIGIAAADGKFPTDTQWQHLAIGAAHLLLVPVGTGIADVRAWKKAHPFPNIFAPTTGAPTQ